MAAAKNAPKVDALKSTNYQFDETNAWKIAPQTERYCLFPYSADLVYPVFLFEDLI